MLPIIFRNKYHRVPSIFDDLFNNVITNEAWGEMNRSAAPRVNISESDKDYSIEVAAPGLGKEDFSVSLKDNLLSISSERKDEQGEEGNHFIRREFNYNNFDRSFELPENVEGNKISAVHKNGVLTVVIPKKEVKVEKAKVIDIA